MSEDTEPKVPVIEGPAILRRHRLVRFSFWIYAAILFTGTHWPNLHSPGPEGSDKIIHIGAFGLWMLLAATQGWFGRRCRTRNLLRTLLVAACVCRTDEGLQAIPFVHRTCAAFRLTANCMGSCSGASPHPAFVPRVVGKTGSRRRGRHGMRGCDRVPVFITMRHGPWIWALSAVLGMLAGANVTHVLPPRLDADGAPIISIVMVAPFAALASRDHRDQHAADRMSASGTGTSPTFPSP